MTLTLSIDIQNLTIQGVVFLTGQLILALFRDFLGRTNFFGQNWTGDKLLGKKQDGRQQKKLDEPLIFWPSLYTPAPVVLKPELSPIVIIRT